MAEDGDVRCDCGGDVFVLSRDAFRRGASASGVSVQPAEAEEAARANDAHRYDLEYDSARNVLPPRDVPFRIASRETRYEAVMRRSDEINAGTDDSPPTRPSERTTDNKEPRT